MAALLAAAAGAQVLLPGTQPADGSGDPAFPPFRDGTNPGTFDRPGACDNCHSDYRQISEPMYEAFETWAGSMMAQAARDPLFWAALDVANQDDALLGDVGVGDFCLRCHVPKAWYEGRSSCATPWGEEFDGSCLVGPADAVDNDHEGLICHFCHRMYDASNPPPGEPMDPAAPYVGNAQVYLSTDRRTMLGPYNDAMPLSHLARGQAFFRSSSLCGQCHDVTNPVRNRRDAATGADLGYRMPIERTFSEYSQSLIGDAAAPEHRTCQDCHMPVPDLDYDGSPDDAYACGQMPGLRGEATALEGPVRKHAFSGGNSWMLGLLRDEVGTALGRFDQLDEGVLATLDLLTLRTVTVDLTAPASVVAGEDLAVSVRVTNLAGHKFPTGYPEGRRAWLYLAAGEDVDSDGRLSPAEVQFESGAWDPATGVLTADPQLHLWEAKLGIWDFNGTGQCDTEDAAGRPIFHFVLNDCVKEDGRIPPLGFVPDAETAPVGRVFPPNPALPGTLANWDDVPYVVPVPDTVRGTFLVEATVRYQTTSKEYVEFLRDESRSTCDPAEPGCDPTLPDARPNRGETMHDLWQRHGRAAPVDMVTASGVVAVTVPPPGACCVGGGCLEIDPAECRLREGDFQGSGSTCATAGCPPPLPPPGEPSDVAAGALPLRVVGRAGDVLGLGFDPACDATDHAVVFGPLSGVSTHSSSGVACGFGAAGTASFDAGPGSSWFVIVGRTDQAEGSYGRDSTGAERPQRVGDDPCDVPQDLSATCM